MKQPSLYLVATPIGNLSDISPRALEILGKADFIAAEDTRTSGVLLNHYGIKKPMVSYYEHNLAERGEEIIARLERGEVCALVSDAGMPAISDPGEVIVRQCYEHGLIVSAVPGPCAAVTALAMSGISTKRFCFEGFLSTAANSRREHLMSLKNEERTIIIYEAPHRLKGTLKSIYDILGDRRISLVREITKIYEEVLLTKISDAIEYYNENTPRGEFVLIIEGASKEVPEIPDDENLRKMFNEKISAGMTKSAAAKELSAETGIPRSEIYDRFKGER